MCHNKNSKTFLIAISAIIIKLFTCGGSDILMKILFSVATIVMF